MSENNKDIHVRLQTGLFRDETGKTTRRDDAHVQLCHGGIAAYEVVVPKDAEDWQERIQSAIDGMSAAVDSNAPRSEIVRLVEAIPGVVKLCDDFSCERV